ncbi:MAG: CHAT domain-containing protein [Pyrinomonadaceae bacterium]|nr:CHAT domain-containing protein [Pyrinomonadaceae bacterium]
MSNSETANLKLRRDFFSEIYERYELYINLLMKMHAASPNENYAIEALQAAERSRARSMLENLALAEADFTKDAPPEIVKREKEILVLLNAKSDKLTALLSGNTEKGETDKLDYEINDLNNELENIKADLKQNSPLYSAIKNPAPFDVGAFQRDVLDENSLLLEFSFGADASYLWLVGKNFVESYILPPREQIESRIENLRKLLDSRGMLKDESIEDYQARIAAAETEFARESQIFSRELLGQVADKIKDKRLIIVPDGKLHYFPIAALPFPDSPDNTPILLTNETIYEPSAATLALLMRNGQKSFAAPKNLLVFSDPIFSSQDARMTTDQTVNETRPADSLLPAENFRFAESLTSLVRLNASKEEADAIVQIVGASESTTLDGAAATRENALDASLADYKIIHFATHGLVNEERPELSGIVLSQVDENGQPRNGVVRLHDIYEMNLSADAVVLSACSTGIGKEVKGEGLLSLKNAFLQVGAKSVVSSLWKVDDYAAQELMKNFYRELVSGNTTTSEAMRRAQISLRQNPQYQSPFYWAAFTVEGDFRNVPKLAADSDNRFYGFLIFPFALTAFMVYRRFKLLNRKTVSQN